MMRTSRLGGSGFGLLCLWAAVALASPQAGWAGASSTWTVNNTSDPASGTASNCAPGNSNTCTLRDALAAAEADIALNPGTEQIIVFAVGSNATITVLATPMTVNQPTTIDGSGSPGLTISGGGAVQVFDLHSGTTSFTTIKHLTIADGWASESVNGGGGIRCLLSLIHVIDVRFLRNKAYYTGGAMYCGGNVNTANPHTVVDSVFDHNVAYYGGAISLAVSTMQVANSRFVANRMQKTQVVGVTCNDPLGAAIHTTGSLTVSDSQFLDNRGDYCEGTQGVFQGKGGAIAVAAGGQPTTITRSLFQGNLSQNGGAIYIRGVANPAPGFEQTFTIDSSVFVGNRVSAGFRGAAIHADTILFKMSNSMVVGNGSSQSLGAFYLIPYASGGSLLYNNTIAGNIAQGPSGVDFESGGSAVPIANSVIGICGVLNEVADMGHNLFSAAPSPCFNFPAPSTLSLPDVTTVIGSLAQNGGTLPTFRLLRGPVNSDPVDAGDDTLCADPLVNAQDVRGFPRPAGAHCDIGAYELDDFNLLFAGGFEDGGLWVSPVEIDLLVGNPAGGTFNFSPAGDDQGCGPLCRLYPPGSDVTITAIPNPGFTFSFTLGCSQNPCSLHLTDKQTVVIGSFTATP